MKKLVSLIVMVGTVALFSSIMTVFPPAQKNAEASFVEPGTIIIDSDLSEWESIPTLITDDFSVVPQTVYYWDTAAGDWTTTDPGYDTEMANFEECLDLQLLKLAHDPDNLYLMWERRDDFTNYYTGNGLEREYYVYSNERPVPVTIDHDLVLSFDTDRSGKYDHYLVFTIWWTEGACGDGPGCEGVYTVTAKIFAESGTDGVYSGKDTETLLKDFSDVDFEVGPTEGCDGCVRQEIRTDLGDIFTYMNIEWNETVIVRYDAYSDLIDSSPPAGYTFDRGRAPVSPSVITGAGPGGGPHVRAFDFRGDVETEPNKLFAYAETYRGGVRVATGDIDADRVDEIITGTGENGGPHLRVFEKDGTQRGIEFFPFDENFRGGMDVASGDFDGDGKEDIAVSQFSNGQAWVKVYRYNSDRTVLFEKNVFGNVECGATVAMGDVDLDGMDEVIVGAGTGGGPQIRVFDYDKDNLEGTLKPIQFFAFHEDSRTGIDVAAGDVDGDGKAEIAASQLKNGQAWVKVYRYNSEQTVLGEWNAYGDPEVGANVDMIDLSGDYYSMEVLTGAGNGGGPQVRAFDYLGTPSQVMNHFFAYSESFRGGVDIAGGYFQSIDNTIDLKRPAGLMST